jgi:hypothetical protein
MSLVFKFVEICLAAVATGLSFCVFLMAIIVWQLEAMFYSGLALMFSGTCLKLSVWRYLQEEE